MLLLSKIVVFEIQTVLCSNVFTWELPIQQFNSYKEASYIVQIIIPEKK